MTNTLLEIEERFESQLNSVEELADFDRHVLDLCIIHIESLNERLKKGPQEVTNKSFLAENTLLAIKSIRQNDSLRIKYQSIFNSCLVLQVSYFTSTLHDIFRHAFQEIAEKNGLPEIKDDLKLSFKELNELSFNLTSSIGELILKKKEISFQDMQSICKAFKNYFDIQIDKDQKCNTIILSQASRHAIVHALGKVDEKFLRQISDANPRDIKHEFNLNDEIKFSASELQFVKLAMLVFIQELREKFKTKYNIE
ncbi:MAG TPA: hypothetical protein PK431_13780 [Chitinophagales bacterium]|nr:hypothetical protein [Chitinophagales bacterium]